MRSLSQLNQRSSYACRLVSRCRCSALLGLVRRVDICYRRSVVSAVRRRVPCVDVPVVPLSNSFISRPRAVFDRSIAIVVVVVFESWSSADAGGNDQEKSEPPRRRLAVHRGPPRGSGHGFGERWHGVGGTAGDGAGTTRRLKNTLSPAASKYAPKTASSSVPHVAESELFEVGGRMRSLHPFDCFHMSL